MAFLSEARHLLIHRGRSRSVRGRTPCSAWQSPARLSPRRRSDAPVPSMEAVAQSCSHRLLRGLAARCSHAHSWGRRCCVPCESWTCTGVGCCGRRVVRVLHVHCTEYILSMYRQRPWRTAQHHVPLLNTRVLGGERVADPMRVIMLNAIDGVLSTEYCVLRSAFYRHCSMESRAVMSCSCAPQTPAIRSLRLATGQRDKTRWQGGE